MVGMLHDSEVRGDAEGLWGSWDLVEPSPWLPSPRTASPDVTAPVLVGLDGGLGGELALEWALRHAADLGAPVVAVTAWSWDARVLRAFGGRTARAAERAQEAQEAQLARVLRRVGPAHCRIDTVLGEGDPATLLLEQSRTARLLVVGTHTEPGGRSAVGTVARACVRLAACPVVVVPVRATA
jgi:nucleotide-binding universal stress UspA family protein